MLVEVLDEGIRLVCDVFRSEPMKVVSVGDDEDGFTIYLTMNLLRRTYLIQELQYLIQIDKYVMLYLITYCSPHRCITNYCVNHSLCLDQS